ALQVLKEIANSHPLVLEDPAPWIDTGELAEYAVNIWFMAYTKKEDYWTAYCDISRIIKERFEQEGIVIPLPRQEIYISEAMAKQDLPRAGSHGQITNPKPHSSFPNGKTA
ncbi:MAG: mechanosensitive ion channel family protein, partial [Moorea sp. SIO3I7]|nr:mechanosensitive ion channel family protein [Moorena sp. SIO3I7]